MPLITINLLQGKTIEQKRALVKDITKVVVNDLGLPSEDMVMIQLIDIPPENIARGGELALDNPPPGGK